MNPLNLRMRLTRMLVWRDCRYSIAGDFYSPDGDEVGLLAWHMARTESTHPSYFEQERLHRLVQEARAQQ